MAGWRRLLLPASGRPDAAAAVDGAHTRLLKTAAFAEGAGAASWEALSCYCCQTISLQRLPSSAAWDEALGAVAANVDHGGGG